MDGDSAVLDLEDQARRGPAGSTPGWLQEPQGGHCGWSRWRELTGEVAATSCFAAVSVFNHQLPDHLSCHQPGLRVSAAQLEGRFLAKERQARATMPLEAPSLLLVALNQLLEKEQQEAS